MRIDEILKLDPWKVANIYLRLREDGSIILTPRRRMRGEKTAAEIRKQEFYRRMRMFRMEERRIDELWQEFRHGKGTTRGT